MINAEQLANVKAVLFGNQKQANVINEAVVQIVAEYLDAESCSMEDEESVVHQIYDVLQLYTKNGVDRDDYTFVLLVTGPKSLQVLQDGVPYVITYDQPSIESPKHNFRITALGEEPEVEVSSSLPSVHATQFDKPAASPEEVIDPQDTIAEQTRKLKDAILPMVPESYKAEITDEYAQALSVAKDYFEYYAK